jgi:hypothetical protein
MALTQTQAASHRLSIPTALPNIKPIPQFLTLDLTVKERIRCKQVFASHPECLSIVTLCLSTDGIAYAGDRHLLCLMIVP